MWIMQGGQPFKLSRLSRQQSKGGALMSMITFLTSTHELSICRGNSMAIKWGIMLFLDKLIIPFPMPGLVPTVDQRQQNCRGIFREWFGRGEQSHGQACKTSTDC